MVNEPHYVYHDVSVTALLQEDGKFVVTVVSVDCAECPPIPEVARMKVCVYVCVCTCICVFVCVCTYMYSTCTL